MSPIARAELAKIKAILASQKPGPRDWLDKIEQRQLDGDETVCMRAKDLAREVRGERESTEPVDDTWVRPA